MSFCFLAEGLLARNGRDGHALGFGLQFLGQQLLHGVRAQRELTVLKTGLAKGDVFSALAVSAM